MAKKKPKVTVEPDEDLEELDELEDLADTEADDDGDEEAEDEDAPKSKKSSTKKAKAKPAKEGIGTAELAHALGTDGRNLRVMLRQKKANETPRFKEQGRYHWKSVDEALEELGFDDAEEAKSALKASRDERLEELKSRNKKSEDKASTKKSSKKKAKVVDEDEDDEDEDDE